MCDNNLAMIRKTGSTATTNNLATIRKTGSTATTVRHEIPII